MKEDVKKVGEILERLDPIVNRFFHQMMDRHGHDVCLSVAANISTTLLTLSILIIERRGGDIDPFIKLMLAEVKSKFDNAHAYKATEDLLAKMTLSPKSGWDTCIAPTKH